MSGYSYTKSAPKCIISTQVSHTASPYPTPLNAYGGLDTFGTSALARKLYLPAPVHGLVINVLRPINVVAWLVTVHKQANHSGQLSLPSLCGR